MQVIITQMAKHNLFSLFEYNANISLQYAIQIDKKIRLYIEDLQWFPYIGRYVPEILDKNYRERICKNYRIIYYIFEKNKTIYIRYIFSSRQNFNLFLKKHKKEIDNFLKSLY